MTDDVRFSLRALRRQRAYAASAIVTLALGIGATTAVFAVIDARVLPDSSGRANPRSAIAYGASAPTRRG